MGGPLDDSRGAAGAARAQRGRRAGDLGGIVIVGITFAALARQTLTVSAVRGRLRIVHLLNELAQLGNGIVNATIDLAIEQVNAGHEVTIAAPDGDFVKLLREHGVRHLRLEPRGGVRPIGAALALHAFIRRHDTQIVHAHMMAGAVIGRIACFGTDAKLVTTVHNSWQRHAVLMRLGHRVIAVSNAVRYEMIRRGIPALRITTVHNASDGNVRGDATAHQPPVTLEHPNVLTIAGMFERKGIVDLIECAVYLRERVANVRIYLAGDGPDRMAFELLARERGVDGVVVFLGFRADIPALLRQADVFVLASRAEPFGLVLSEARSAAVPIVATRVGGIPEALDDGRAGTLVPSSNPRALAAALAHMLLDDEHRETMRQGASSNAGNRHVARASRETVDVYRDTLVGREVRV
jgi:glycosyltransferase involved in cell wall biosynthesis